MMQLSKVDKVYRLTGEPVYALKNIDLEISQGESLAIVGKSGSGKSTLLNIISGIDRPSSGDIAVSGQALNDLNENQFGVAIILGLFFNFFN